MSNPIEHPEAAGRGEGQSSTRITDNLDAADHGDRYKIRRAIRNGWLRELPEWKRKAFLAMDKVLDHADPADPNGVKAIVSVTQCILVEQGQTLKDVHKVEDDERLDAGKLTSRSETVVKSPIDHDATRSRILAGIREPSPN